MAKNCPSIIHPKETFSSVATSTPTKPTICSKQRRKRGQRIQNPYCPGDNEPPVEEYPLPQTATVRRPGRRGGHSHFPWKLCIPSHLSRGSKVETTVLSYPIVSRSFVVMSRIANEILLGDKRRPPVLVSGKISLSEETMFNEVLKKLLLWILPLSKVRIEGWG